MQQDKNRFKEAYLNKLETMFGRTVAETSVSEKFQALSGLVRDYIAKQWISTGRHSQNQEGKQVYYLCIEYLLGRQLAMHLVNLGLRDTCAAALHDLGIDLGELEAQEEDPGLGNGGLGRLAACYLESMAAQGFPGHGCGILYRYGFFEQKIVDGAQIELPDDWLKNGHLWQFRRREEAVPVKFGGVVRTLTGGRLRYVHEDFAAVAAVPYDLPVTGYNNGVVNTLRLWSAESVPEDFACSMYHSGDCQQAIYDRTLAENISHVLYPDDSSYEGRVLRLKQQYFLVSASLQSIIKQIKKKGLPLQNLAKHAAIHINDTHPALAVPEMMRILLDEEDFGWDEAWQVTVDTLSYTNHTILPEALEKWPVEMFQDLLPRIYIIVNEINERFCRDLWQRYPGEWERIRSMAVIADGHIHMAHLAFVGSHSVNGVARIHTEILKSLVMEPFHNFYPHRLKNVTNGINHRRWLLKINPGLAELISETIGSSWLSHPCELMRLLKYAADPAFQEKQAQIKYRNKNLLADHIRRNYGIKVDPASIFDAHIKRIHGYKRQTMNALHIMHLYNLLRENPAADIAPRTFIFAGKAAPGYQQAKRTIRLLNALAEKVNHDKTIGQRLKVVFMENYNVSLAELIIPGSDVSEQIPTASREACGTGNMKFMLNGAITIGTLDGANIEIMQAVGPDNIITFGLTAEEVLRYYREGGYNPWDVYNSDPRIKTTLDQLVNGFFSAARDEFRPLYDAFLHHYDEYFVLKDFAAYADAQARIGRLYADRPRWLSMCLHNIAHAGKFSSDRTFTEYALDIWQIPASVSVRCFCRSDEQYLSRRQGCIRETREPSQNMAGTVLSDS